MEKFSWLSDQGRKVLIDHLQDGIFVIEEGKLTYVNQGLAKMLGYQVNELIGRSFIELVSKEDRPLVLARYRARLAGEKVPDQYEIRLPTPQGSVIFCALNIGMIESPTGHTVIVGSARDVTKQKAEQSELKASEMELKAIFNQLPDVFYRTNMQGVITMISPVCFDIIGYRQEEMLGTAMSDYYETPEGRQKILQAIADGGGKATQVEAGLRHKNGSIIWISTNAFVRFDKDGQPICVEGIARDISERKQMEDRLTTMSRTDGLTGVYSRSYFMDKSETLIELMRRYQRPASMMTADLDRFKNINDNYGHHAGDLALIAFTNACKQVIRDSDVFGRLGGEEFCLLLPETPIQNAQILAERIRKATAAIQIPVGDNMIGITVSIGVVELKVEDPSLDSLLRRADLAMYQAKERGRNQVVASFEPL